MKNFGNVITIVLIHQTKGLRLGRVNLVKVNYFNSK